MKKNSRRKKNDLTPLILIGGVVLVIYLMNKKKYVVTIDPISDPEFPAIQQSQPANDILEVWDPVRSLLPEYQDSMDYYQVLQGQMNGASRRRRGSVPTMH